MTNEQANPVLTATLAEAEESAIATAQAQPQKPSRTFIPPQLVKQGQVAAITLGFGGSLTP